MGKSKRNRKKQSKVAPQPEIVSPTAEKSVPRPKNKLWLAIAVAVLLIGGFLLFRGPSPPPATTSTSSQASPSTIPLVQSGSSNSLSPSGSLDLQPTGSAAQAGSAQ
jgi:hypothetical protein